MGVVQSVLVVLKSERNILKKVDRAHEWDDYLC